MKKFLLIFFSTVFLSPFTGISQTITIGTGTSTNTATSYPAPYGNWFFGARHQFIIRASEINSLTGGTGAKYINSLAFNVSSSSVATLNGFEIKLCNSSLTNFPGSGFSFQTGFTSVFGPVAFKDKLGWNVHTFKAPFYWDGVSNLMVEVCFNNTSYKSNSSVYYSVMPFVSTAYRYSDGSNNCTNTALYASTKRPNMQLGFISPLPPVASFNIIDSPWVNVQNTVKNISTYFNKSYWNIKPVTANRFCNEYGCFMDSNVNFKYKFTSPGDYEITLVVKGFFGVDSMKKIVHVDYVSRKPQANFYASSQSVSTPTQMFFYDSSLYGVMGWEWSINPPCYHCGENIFEYPNMFLPNGMVQNPSMYTFDPGLFDVCLKIWNDLGADSVCKKDYLNVIKGYTMCNGSDSISNLSTGYIYDSGGPDQNYQIGLIGQCNAGFVINPSTCSDTIILFIDQFRLRTTDTLQIRDGGSSSSPLIAKLSGNNLPAANKIVKAKSGKMYIRMTTGSGGLSAGDSGYIAHWTISRASSIVALSNYLCPGDSMKLTVAKKTDRAYLWKLNNQPLGEFTDSVCYAKTQGTYQLIVTTPSCIDSSSLTIMSLEKTHTAFTINNTLQCLNTNNFVFIDKSTLSDGKYSRLWRLGDNTTSQDSSLNKVYSITGTYIVSLVTVTYQGCKDSLVQYIRIADVPESKIVLSSSNNVCEYDSVLLSSSILHANNYHWYRNTVSIPGDNLTSLWTKEAGYYSLKVTDNLGCASISAPVSVFFKQQPSKPFISKHQDTLMSSSINGNHWYLNDSLITGSNEKFYLPVKKGKYAVEVDSNGCKNISAPFVFNFTGINSSYYNNHFLQLFPNPATNMINAVSDKIFSFIITDITGRVLLNSSNVSNNYRIDISSFSKGVYFMKSFDEENISVTRFEKF